MLLVITARQATGERKVILVHQHGRYVQTPGEAFFVAPADLHGPGLTARVESSQGHVSPVERSDTSEGAVQTPDKQRSRQQAANESSLKDEYSYNLSRFTHNIHEYEQGQKSIIVRGRLKENIQFWQDIDANDFVLDVIQNGYKIPFYS